MGSCLRKERESVITVDGNEGIHKISQNFRRRKNSNLSNYSTSSRHVVESPVRIGSFNVQRFGPSKMSDPQVVQILVGIIVRYDILLMQEIVDNKGLALKQLLEKVNEEVEEKYSLEVSPRIGRNKAKEQYAFFYKSNRFKVKKSAVFDDSKEDIFIREPFVVSFSTSCLYSEPSEEDIESSETNFVCVGIHTQPKNAATEIDALDDVRKWVQSKFRTNNIMILGDLNASSPYISSTDWASNRLKTNKKYHWLIPDHIDTTANHTLAAYDRIIFYGDHFIKLMIPESAQVFRYNEHHHFSHVTQELLLKVSDHYPVEVELKPRLHPVLEKSVKIYNNVTIIEDHRPVGQNFNLPNGRNDKQTIGDFTLSIFYNNSNRITLAQLSAQFTESSSACSGLENLRDRRMIPYSLFVLAQKKIVNNYDNGKEIVVQISHDFFEEKTSVLLFQ